VLNASPVKLVKDNPLGEPQEDDVLPTACHVVPSHTSRFLMVVFQRTAPLGSPEQLDCAAAAALPKTYWGYCHVPLTQTRLLPPAGCTRLAPLVLPLMPAVAGVVHDVPCV
jgi:hypothetical protein